MKTQRAYYELQMRLSWCVRLRAISSCSSAAGDIVLRAVWNMSEGVSKSSVYVIMSEYSLINPDAMTTPAR